MFWNWFGFTIGPVLGQGLPISSQWLSWNPPGIRYTMTAPRFKLWLLSDHTGTVVVTCNASLGYWGGRGSTSADQRLISPDRIREISTRLQHLPPLPSSATVFEFNNILHTIFFVRFMFRTTISARVFHPRNYLSDLDYSCHNRSNEDNRMRWECRVARVGDMTEYKYFVEKPGQNRPLRERIILKSKRGQRYGLA